jgi:hypothetical protein
VAQNFPVRLPSRFFFAKQATYIWPTGRSDKKKKKSGMPVQLHWATVPQIGPRASLWLIMHFGAKFVALIDPP